MKKWYWVVAAMGFAFAAPAPVTFAQERTTTVSADAKFVLDVNVEEIKKSPFGGHLIELAKQKANEELSKDKDSKFSYEKVIEVLGFDPVNEIRSLTISSSDFESPEESLVATIRLRKTTGNLEGLVLGLPGYEASEYGKYQVHSIKPDDKVQLYASIYSSPENEKLVLIAAKKQLVTQLLDQLDGKSGVADGFKVLKWNSDLKELLHLQVLQIPKALTEDGPQANVSKMLKSLALRVVDAGKNLDVALQLTTTTEKQAEQVKQLVQGAIAMLELAQSIEDKDEDLAKIQKFLQGVKTERDGATIKAVVSVPIESLQGLIEELDSK